MNTVAVYKDLVVGEGRGVSSVSWALGEDKIALAYCNPDFLAKYFILEQIYSINTNDSGIHHMQRLPMFMVWETQAHRSLNFNQVKR